MNRSPKSPHVSAGPARAKASRGRPRTLTEQDIVDAARRVMEREGYAALSIRSLGKQLGMAHSNLYHYVKNVEDVEAAVLRQLLARLEKPRATDAAGLRGEFLQYLRAARGVLLEHPHVVSPPVGSAAWQLLTSLTTTWLTALGRFEPNLRLVAGGYSALMSYVASHAEEQRRSGPDFLETNIKALRKAFPEQRAVAGLERELAKGPDVLMMTTLEELVDRLFPGLTAPVPRRSTRGRGK